MFKFIGKICVGASVGGVIGTRVSNVVVTKTGGGINHLIYPLDVEVFEYLQKNDIMKEDPLHVVSLLERVSFVPRLSDDTACLVSSSQRKSYSQELDDKIFSIACTSPDFLYSLYLNGYPFTDRYITRAKLFQEMYLSNKESYDGHEIERCLPPSLVITFSDMNISKMSEILNRE